MIYTISKTEEGYILKIDGDLDLYSSYGIREEVHSLYQHDPDHIVVDLSGLNYIDSAGIGLLLELKKNATQNSKQCEIKNVPPDILKMLRTLHLDVILHIK